MPAAIWGAHRVFRGWRLVGRGPVLVAFGHPVPAPTEGTRRERAAELTRRTRRRCARCSSRWCAPAGDRPRSAPARPVGAAGELRPRGRAGGRRDGRRPGPGRRASGSPRAGGARAAAGIAGRARRRRPGARAGHRARRLPVVGHGDRARAAPLRTTGRAHPGVRRSPPPARRRSPGGRDARRLGGLRAAPAHRLRRLVQRRRPVPGGQHAEGRDPGGRGAAGAAPPASGRCSTA